MSGSDLQVETIKVQVFPDGRINTKNAAAFIGLSEKTMAMMRCAGKGPKFIKRGRIFYYLDDLTAWMKNGEARSTSQSRVR